VTAAFDTFFSAADRAMHEALGPVQAVAYRHHGLRDNTRRSTPTLTLMEDAAAGATELLVSGVGLVGLLPAACVLSLAGNDYDVAADAQAVGNVLTVTVSQALLADAGAGAPVTVAAGTIPLEDALVFSPQERQLNPAIADRIVFGISVLRLPGVELRGGDTVTLPDGRSGDLLAMGNEDAGAWDFYVGAPSVGVVI
jgi:hypothetical protein